MEQVQEQCLHRVVEVVAERDAGGADAPGVGIENAAAQARTHRAGSLALRGEGLHHAVGVLLENVMFEAQPGQIVAHDLRRVTRLLLVEMYRDQLERHRGGALQVEQHV
jgi:hypothetical protein